jgi:hypothetical protein
MDRSSRVRLTKTVAEKAEVRDTRYDLGTWRLPALACGSRRAARKHSSSATAWAGAVGLHRDDS